MRRQLTAMALPPPPKACMATFYEVYMERFRWRKMPWTDVRPLLEILWQLLPAEYTGGASFAQWCESG